MGRKASKTEASKKAEAARLRAKIVEIVHETGRTPLSVSDELGIPRSTFYYWRNNHPDFVKQCQFAKIMENEDVDDLSDWRDRYLACLKSGMSRTDALKIVNKGVMDVVHEIDDNKEFSQRLMEIEIEQTWDIEDSIKAMAKTSTAHARLWLSRKESEGGTGKKDAVSRGEAVARGLRDGAHEARSWFENGMKGADRPSLGGMPVPDKMLKPVPVDDADDEDVN